MSNEQSNAKERSAPAQEVARRRALVLASPGLQPYGTVEEVAELIRRFKVMLPETERMTDGEVVALAQVAYIHGLNPLPAVREIVWIPGRGAMVGIRGLRRKGREWAEVHDLGYPDLQFTLVVDPVEREQKAIPEGALCYKCDGGFPAQRSKWVEDAKTLREALGADAPYQIILDSIGAMPSTTGYGYVAAEEMAKLDNPKWWHKCPPPNGKGVPHYGFEPCPSCGEASKAEPPKFSHNSRAMKRAEAHWWTQAADLPFAVTPSGEGVADLEEVPFIVEGEVTDLPAMGPDSAEAYSKIASEDSTYRQRDAARTPEERKEAATRGADALFGGKQEPTSLPTAPPRATERPFAPETVRSRWNATVRQNQDAKAEQHRGSMELYVYVAWQLRECFAGDKEVDEKAHSVIAFLTEGRTTSSKELTGPELVATEKWLDVGEHDGAGAGLRPRRESRMEAIQVVLARMKELGQEPLLA